MVDEIIERGHKALIDQWVEIFQSAASQPISRTFLASGLASALMEGPMRGKVPGGGSVYYRWAGHDGP